MFSRELKTKKKGKSGGVLQIINTKGNETRTALFAKTALKWLKSGEKRGGLNIIVSCIIHVPQGKESRKSISNRPNTTRKAQRKGQFLTENPLSFGNKKMAEV